MTIDDEYLLPDEVRLPDGSIIESSHYAHARIIDLLASSYGLGGCKTLSEFAQMVDEEDPVLISDLVKAIVERHENMYGDKKRKPGDPITTPKGDRLGLKHMPITKTGKSQIGVGTDAANRIGMKRFLLDIGGDKKQIEEAIRKVESGETEISDLDLSWITPELLSDPSKDFSEVFNKLREHQKKGANIKISGQQFHGPRKG